MKILIMILTLSFLLIQSAFADIEALPEEANKPTVKEISISRACFEEVIKAGCSHPKEDQSDFRTCMSSVYSSLTPGCRSIMTNLYTKK